LMRTGMRCARRTQLKVGLTNANRSPLGRRSPLFACRRHDRRKTVFGRKWKAVGPTDKKRRKSLSVARSSLSRNERLWTLRVWPKRPHHPRL
jgi:hypothetical protein